MSRTRAQDGSIKHSNKQIKIFTSHFKSYTELQREAKTTNESVNTSNSERN